MKLFPLHNVSFFRRGALSLLILFVAGNFDLKAQAAKVIDNDLNRSSNLSIGGTFLGIDIYNPNLNFFAEGELFYRFKKERVWLRGNYKIAYGDRIEAVTEASSFGDAVPANGTQPLRSIGGTIGYNFKKKKTVAIARATFFNRVKTKSAKMALESWRLYGVHVGYDLFRTIVAQGSTTGYTGTSDESFLAGATINIGNATPMLNMTIISAGIHRQLLEHYVVEATNGSDGATIKNKSVNMVYADFLFGMNMIFDNVLVPFNSQAPNSALPSGSGGNYNTAYNFYSVDINSSYKKIPIGGRIGWQQTTLNAVGLITGFEAGFRPGIVDPFYNLYLMFKIGISFNMRAK